MSRRLRYASEMSRAGIGMAARRTIASLVAAGVDLAWEPLTDTAEGRVRAIDSAVAPTELRALRRSVQPGEPLVLHSVPETWKQIAQQVGAGYQIGHSVWETDRVPTRWRSQMSDIDEFWVPTYWNKYVFEAAFDRPVHVVPHAVTDALIEPIPAQIPDDHQVVSMISTWDWRKRPDRAIEAFARAFTRDDPVTLVVKTAPWVVGWPGSPTNVRNEIARILGRVNSSAHVLVALDEWTDGEIAGLLDRSTCFLSLTSSEGWGLGAFDAACRGVPVIITGYGGQVEYLGADYPGLLPFKMVPTDHPDQQLFEPGSMWGFPDIDQAVDMLRAVVAGGYPELKRVARDLAPVLRTRYSQQAIGSIASALLNAGAFASSPSISDQHSPAAPVTPKVVVLTPVKNSAHRADAYVDRLLALEYPADQLAVKVLVSDSDDGTAEAFELAFKRLERAGVETAVFERDFGYRLPTDVPRWHAAIQVERRRVLALSRNHLLSRGLGDADWALWLDCDVIGFPADTITRLIAAGHDIVQPHCLALQGGDTFDLNAWTDQGAFHLDDYRGHESVELHAVGGTMLLVRADRHRDGLVYPPFLYGVGNARVRTNPEQTGRVEPGEIETEGLGIMANDMGIACVGLPDFEIWHE